MGKASDFYHDVVLTHEEDACLFWPHARNGGGGYANLKYGGRVRFVHRLVCEVTHGPPPTSRHEAAHTCGKGSLGCVAKAHLVWKTTSQNHADKIEHGTHQTLKTHCRNGHPYTEANVRITQDANRARPHRRCKTCERLSHA